MNREKKPAILCPDDWRTQWLYRRQIRRIKSRGLLRWIPVPFRKHG